MSWGLKAECVKRPLRTFVTPDPKVEAPLNQHGQKAGFATSTSAKGAKRSDSPEKRRRRRRRGKKTSDSAGSDTSSASVSSASSNQSSSASTRSSPASGTIAGKSATIVESKEEAPAPSPRKQSASAPPAKKEGGEAHPAAERRLSAASVKAHEEVQRKLAQTMEVNSHIKKDSATTKHFQNRRQKKLRDKFKASESEDGSAGKE